MHVCGQQLVPTGADAGTATATSCWTTCSSTGGPTTPGTRTGSPRPHSAVSRRGDPTLGADGITANSLMPGGIFINLQRHWDPDVLARAKAQHGSAAKTPEQGAATSVLLATSPALAGVGGRR